MTTSFAAVHDLARRTVSDPRYPVNTYTLDALWVLYDRILHITPDTVDSDERDRFLLSKGHGCAPFYATLAAKGFIPHDWLDTIASSESALGGHPNATRIPGVEISSGSLGHGLPIGVGTALGLSAQGLTTPRVYVMVGDGELDEGSNHEAIAFAGATGMSNLTVIVADNSSSSHGWNGGIASRFTINGWTGVEVEARDHDALHTALTAHTPHAPHVVVATSH